MTDRVEIEQSGEYWRLSLGNCQSLVKRDPSIHRQYQFTDVIMSAMAAELHEMRGKLAIVEEALNAELSKQVP